MLFLLFVLLGFVQATIKDDIGDIPYENQEIAMERTMADRTKSLTTTASEYGDIPYEKVFSKAEIGDIPYEEIVFRPRVKDYGNIPYEKPDINIKGKIMEILGDRVTELVETKKYTDRWGSPLAPNFTPSKALSTMIMTIISNGTIKLRAESRSASDEAFIDYHSPAYIDDSDCNPAKQNCSFCTDKSGYRVYCLNGTTTAAPNDLKLLLDILSDIAYVYEDYSRPKILNFAAWNKSIYLHHPYGWVSCPPTTTTTDTPAPTDPPHKNTGLLIAKCYVCGMLEPGVPRHNSMCGDSFLSKTYKKHCRFLNREGFYLNGSNSFYMWGQWTGGCSMRFTDISDVYTQRTCRNNKMPALGSHYVSRRMRKLEMALKADKDACVTTPQASLVPLSRGISLYSRFTVCVCSTNYCNGSDQQETLHWFTGVFGLAIALHLLRF